MRNRYSTLILLPIFAGAIAGCEHEEQPVASYQQIDKDNGALATNAASRLVMDRLPPANGAPTRLICSEPSPDIAIALSTALALTGSGKTPSGVTASVGYSESTAEAITALAGRTEAVVALRDGLFKACEAYANGLIQKGAYALILSQYGDLLVTLMLSEAAATAAQKSGAAAPAPDGASPSPSSAQPSATLKADLTAVQKALADVAKADGEPADSKTKTADAQSAEKELVTAATNMAKASTPPPATAQPATPAKPAAAPDPISTIYATYYAKAPIRILQSLVVTCLEQDDAGITPIATPGPSRAAVCGNLYAALSANMAAYLAAAYAPAK